MVAPKQCLSSVQFGSFLAYSPHGRSEESKQSRAVTYDIKKVKPGHIHYMAQRLVEEMQPGKSAYLLGQLLGPDVLVVPCPRSAPLVPGGLWPSKEICDEFVRQGLAMRSAELIKRVKAVQKASVAPPGERPTPMNHIKSMDVVDQGHFVPEKITVVDDVVTKGATLIAAATHMKNLFPDATVQAFAVVRTMSYGEVNKIVAPVIGEITFKGHSASRNP